MNYIQTNLNLIYFKFAFFLVVFKIVVVKVTFIAYREEKQKIVGLFYLCLIARVNEPLHGTACILCMQITTL